MIKVKTTQSQDHKLIQEQNQRLLEKAWIWGNLKTYNLYFHPLYEGGSKSPCNHLFSLHMGAFIQRWQFLHQV